MKLLYDHTESVASMGIGIYTPAHKHTYSTYLDLPSNGLVGSFIDWQQDQSTECRIACIPVRPTKARKAIRCRGVRHKARIRVDLPDALARRTDDSGLNTILDWPCNECNGHVGQARIVKRQQQHLCVARQEGNHLVFGGGLNHRSTHSRRRSDREQLGSR